MTAAPLAALLGAPPTDARRAARLVLLLLALATTSPFAPWAAACAAAVDTSHALLLLGGLVSGFLAGLLGIGGALVTLPVLYAALPGLGVPAAQVPATAVATALMAMLPTTILAAWRQHAHGALDLGTLARMAAPMAAGGIVGALLACQLRGPALALMFATQSICYGMHLIADRAGANEPRPSAVTQLIGRAPCWVAGPAMAGFCACVGMGGGSIVTPYLMQRFALPFRHAVATSSALNLSIAVGGSLAFFVSASGAAGGTVSAHLTAAILLAAGAMASVTLGVFVSHRLPTVVFRRAVGAINVTAAATLLLQIARS